MNVALLLARCTNAWWRGAYDSCNVARMWLRHADKHSAFGVVSYIAVAVGVLLGVLE